MKVKEISTVVSQNEISDGIFDLVIRAPKIASGARPGQFADLYVNDAGKLLPRPISLCGIDPEKGTLRLVYRVSGEKSGTAQLSGMQAGETFSVIGPLGNGFPLDQAVGKKVFLIGGGIGIPPMLESAKQLYEKNKAAGVSVVNEIVLGYRSDLFLAKEFEPYGHVVIATEDGNGGTKGTVLDAICEQGLSAEMIFSCGPKPMLRALKAFSEEQKIPCQVSMEERMACGVGACLGCVTRTVRKDEHSQVNNVRVCKDGPVFDARDIVL